MPANRSNLRLITGANAPQSSTKLSRIRPSADGAGTVRSLGLPVDQLLDLLAQVRDWEALVSRHPGLEPDDVREALEYAADRAIAS